MPIRSIKIIVLVSLGAGILFFLACLVCNCMELSKNLYMGLFGVFVGILTVPEVEKKLVKHKALYQIFFGVVFGLSTAFVFGANTEWYLASVFGGALFGLSTPVWYHGIHFPC